MTRKNALAALILNSLMAGSTLAAVSPEEASRLGQDLTPMGAEAAGNADGSIPPWNPAGTPVPADFVAGSDNYVNPYAGEKPLYTIDASNWQQYADVLTEGTKEIFEKYGADGFKVDVYPTKRDFVTPDWLYANTARNATGASLVADGQKVEGHYPGVPFPIPQDGMEVLWNHLSRYLTDFSINYDTYYVDANGKPILSTTGYMTTTLPMFEVSSQPFHRNHKRA